MQPETEALPFVVLIECPDVHDAGGPEALPLETTFGTTLDSLGLDFPQMFLYKSSLKCEHTKSQR